MMIQQTLTQLRTLKLDGFADGLEEQLTQPGAASLSFEGTPVTAGRPGSQLA